MPAPAPAGTAAPAQKQAAAPQMVVPFVRGSGLHRESVFDSAYSLLANTQDIPPIDVNAYGYMRSLVILVTTNTPGTATTAATVEDGPFNALQNIQLMQPNGFPFYQVTSGYSSYAIQKYGGYQGYNDPKAHPSFSYSSGAGVAPTLGFFVRIPVELNVRDALGSLPNKNAAAPFKLKMTLNTLANVFGGSITVSPNIRVRVYLEAWDQPADVLNGQSVQVTPPAMNTIQYWTEQPITVAGGQFNARLTRMGNYLRETLFILRRAASTRVNGDTDWPDPLTILIDQRNQDYIAKTIWQSDVYEKWGYTGAADTLGARDSGVYPYDWAHEFDGRVGHENRDLWLPTIEATRFELSGSWGNAGTLTVLTNDIAPQGNVFV